ncbi:MAG TPA: urease accessory protein UreF [Pseudomonadales bacterium]|nr:urease accessory protein UreF [Pseudomonadales bacterium]
MSLEVDPAALHRLLSWMSPSYPVGAYTYSHGLEWALECGDVRGVDGVRGWLDGVLRHGSGRSDAALLTQAWQARDREALLEVMDLAWALAPSRERRLETGSQGRAFLDATVNAWPCARLDWLAGQAPERLPYPVVVGLAAAGHGVPLEAMLHAYLHGFVANLVSAAVRLVPLGQSDGQRLVAAFSTVIDAVVAEVLADPVASVGGCALLADIASMRHETQYSRLFRS